MTDLQDAHVKVITVFVITFRPADLRLLFSSVPGFTTCQPLTASLGLSQGNSMLSPMYSVCTIHFFISC